MQETKYAQASEVACISPNIHFCLGLESLCDCILAWVGTLSLTNIPYILVALQSILHFQRLFCDLRDFLSWKTSC